MGNLAICYSFHFEKDRVEKFNLQFDEKTLEPVGREEGELPEWTDLSYCQCSHCPLSPESHAHCPVAVSLVDVLQRFDGLNSYDTVVLEVVASERRLCQRTTMQKAMGSLIGLLFATSGCPHTVFMKPMARFHLPLASEDDTIYRAAGMYLLAQYFVMREGCEGDFQLRGLEEIYQNLHILNTGVAERVRKATHTDSSVNAVILLDMFAKLLPYVIEDHLDEIRHLFEPYLPS